MKILVEPTGCLAAAALLHGLVDVKDKRVGVVISGGNVDLATFARLTAAKRPDAPNAAAGVARP